MLAKPEPGGQSRDSLRAEALVFRSGIVAACLSGVECLVVLGYLYDNLIGSVALVGTCVLQVAALASSAFAFRAGAHAAGLSIRVVVGLAGAVIALAVFLIGGTFILIALILVRGISSSV